MASKRKGVEGTEPVVVPEVPEIPDVDALLASHEAVLKEQRELAREEREREREAEEARREQGLAELRTRHEQDLETIEGLIEKGRLLMQAAQWRRNPQIAEALKAIRAHVKRISDPVDGDAEDAKAMKQDLLKVLYTKAISEMNAVQTHAELGAAFERLVMQGNLITGPALEEFVGKSPARKADVFRVNGEDWIFPGNPVALVAATKQARQRAGAAYGKEQEEIRERILENSVLLPSQLLGRDRVGLGGLCAFETEHHFPYEPDKGYKGTVVFSVEGGCVTLNRVFGPLAAKLRRYEGQTWKPGEKYDPVVYHVLRHAAEAAGGQAVHVGSYGSGKSDGSSSVAERLGTGPHFQGHPNRHTAGSPTREAKPPEAEDGSVAEAVHIEGNGSSPIGDVVDLATVKAAVGRKNKK